ncbi:hypothetical protein ACH5Y9_06770 [Methylomonas sp. BW4-1]|uniref:hypothetical protein n=1 Tax=unclassified Methylomonas TaxID=2608980 RepID=UPI0014918C6B|nr:hypothetical protein [Methylomonas sp. ZR1]NOV29277.1 hypothetical protein [Methylomonas sp. ZR1]
MSQKSKLDQGLKVLQPEEISQVSGGLVDVGTDLSQFPRKFWPVINPGSFVIKANAGLVVR